MSNDNGFDRWGKKSCDRLQWAHLVSKEVDPTYHMECHETDKPEDHWCSQCLWRETFLQRDRAIAELTAAKDKYARLHAKLADAKLAMLVALRDRVGNRYRHPPATIRDSVGAYWYEFITGLIDTELARRGQ